jgi:hypothetical protein|tara:strand:+ start:193 stop:930 length:738 start_codon:yes stop_codon:yes gene_type:complete
MAEFNIPTEVIELPSKGLLYPKASPLSSGKVEMKYMTAKEEDILTNQNLIKSGEVIDKLLQSLIIDKINYNDLFIGDKNAIMIAARILSYGSSYEFDHDGVRQDIDLGKFEIKDLHPDFEKAETNEFSFKLPHSNNEITFKLLTHGDEKIIDEELKGLKKINKFSSNDVTARLAHLLTSINGSREKKDIREFVNNYFLAKDSRAFRKYYSTVSPDIDMNVTLIDSDSVEEEATLPIGINFFWPDA